MPLNFPTSKSEWRLDVVSLLAVIGESSMSKHAQTLTASWLCLLPRLIPAPQALIRPARPGGLPSEIAHVVGVHSGNYLMELNYFANLVHPIRELKRHSVCEVFIEHKPITEKDHPYDQDKIKEILPKLFSFLSFLTVGSSLLSIGLLAWAALNQDGPACLAIIVISITSSMVGLASWWEPSLTERPYHSDVPPGDIVIRTRNGAFVVVHCTEEVARELYVGAEDCKYCLGTRPAQVLVGSATVLLMIGVVLIGNCTFELQVALGASYIILNGLYWVAALLPSRFNWDLRTRYEWKISDCRTEPSYTLTLYQAILAASRYNDDKSVKTSWVRTSNAAPDTSVWNKWLDEVAQRRDSDIGGISWDPVKCWASIKSDDDAERGIVKVENDTHSLKRVIRRPTDDSKEPKTRCGKEDS